MIHTHRNHHEFRRSPLRPLIFGIDFDNTWSADPDLLALFVESLRTRGHSAVIVTGRSDVGMFGIEVQRAVESLGIPIVFAARRWKRAAALEEGFKVDIWMDDMPEYIGPQDGELLAGKFTTPAVSR